MNTVLFGIFIYVLLGAAFVGGIIYGEYVRKRDQDPKEVKPNAYLADELGLRNNQPMAQFNRRETDGN